MTSGAPDPKRTDSDAARAIRFIAVKFAVFAVLPVVIAGLIVYWQLG
jgi:hypothetical protein